MKLLSVKFNTINHYHDDCFIFSHQLLFIVLLMPLPFEENNMPPIMPAVVIAMTNSITVNIIVRLFIGTPHSNLHLHRYLCWHLRPEPSGLLAMYLFALLPLSAPYLTRVKCGTSGLPFAHFESGTKSAYVQGWFSECHIAKL